MSTLYFATTLGPSSSRLRANDLSPIEQHQQRLRSICVVRQLVKLQTVRETRQRQQQQQQQRQLRTGGGALEVPAEWATVWRLHLRLSGNIQQQPA
ncbi:GL25628 [Drosophila persimilis]|uniref:GL25628 n=1 Tax=Drosophila persimilis TaxID=7234 RepID=B4GKV0_DROPE|nr:GL25628 [Drosophila persimilis]